MGHSYYDGWDTKPKLDEARFLAPEVPPHSSRGRKDTRKWCRGKEGVEHTLEIRLSKWGDRIKARHPESDYAGCKWYQQRHWVSTAIGRHWEPVPDDWRYHCNHERFCTQCGKILNHSVAIRDCPDWKPRETLGPRRG